MLQYFFFFFFLAFPSPYVFLVLSLQFPTSQPSTYSTENDTATASLQSPPARHREHTIGGIKRETVLTKMEGKTAACTLHS